MSLVFDSNEFIPTQKKALEVRINQILDDFMEPLFEGTIIDEIKSLAMAANMPQSFIDGVKFVRVAPNRGNIINTWGTEDEPLAKYFNYGTIDHWIEPTTEDGVLAWPGKAGTHASAIFFQGSSKKNDALFSKGHYVSGVPKTEVMERGFNIGKGRLAVEAGKLVREELQNE